MTLPYVTVRYRNLNISFTASPLENCLSMTETTCCIVSVCLGDGTSVHIPTAAEVVRVRAIPFVSSIAEDEPLWQSVQKEFDGIDRHRSSRNRRYNGTSGKAGQQSVMTNQQSILKNERVRERRLSARTTAHRIVRINHNECFLSANSHWSSQF